jgi:hypothetical protein
MDDHVFKLKFKINIQKYLNKVKIIKKLKKFENNWKKTINIDFC